MCQTVVASNTKRYAWVAVALSLLLTGLGQVYCGRLTRGLVFACLGILAIPITAAMLANEVVAGSLALVLVGVGGLLGITVVAAVDAFRLARRTRSDYVVKEYNRLAVYLLLLVLGKGGALGALLYARDHLIEAFIVPSRSMVPAIELGDRVLGNKTAYRNTDPSRGHVIIFRDPENWRRNLVKRIVAVAGDTIEVKDGRGLVNGVALDRPSAAASSRAAPGKNMPLQTVPAHHCFVLGDNLGESHDGRHFGPIPLTSIVARVDYLYWPATGWWRLGRIR